MVLKQDKVSHAGFLQKDISQLFELLIFMCGCIQWQLEHTQHSERRSYCCKSYNPDSTYNIIQTIKHIKG